MNDDTEASNEDNYKDATCSDSNFTHNRKELAE